MPLLFNLFVKTLVNALSAYKDLKCEVTPH